MMLLHPRLNYKQANFVLKKINTAEIQDFSCQHQYSNSEAIMQGELGIGVLVGALLLILYMLYK